MEVSGHFHVLVILWLGKSPQYVLDTRVCGSHKSQFGHGSEEKNPFLHLLGTKLHLFSL
jgi:hypothetical protein